MDFLSQCIFEQAFGKTSTWCCLLTAPFSWMEPARRKELYHVADEGNSIHKIDGFIKILSNLLISRNILVKDFTYDFLRILYNFPYKNLEIVKNLVL